MRTRLLIFPVILMLFWLSPASAQYCQPAYSNGCSYGDGLILFKLNTITQVLECPWNRGYYQDCSTQTTEMEAGKPYILTVQSGFPGVNVTVWADLNDDLAFDSTEIMVQGFECTFDSTDYTTVITLPENTTEGYHRLRYRTSWMVHVPDPCDTLGYGNAADFTIHTRPARMNHAGLTNEFFTVYPNPANNFATVENKNAGTALIELVDLSGKTIISEQSDNVSIPLDLSRIAPGMYFLKFTKGSNTAFTYFSITK